MSTFHAVAKKKAIWLALLGVIGVLLVPAPTPASGATTPVSPFDSPTVFCTKSAAPPGARSSSSPGVTPNSITITDASFDVAGLRRLGFNIPVDFSSVWKLYFDEINKCGGINGRKIVLKRAAYNLLASDLGGHAAALCLKITEDQKAAVAVSIGGPPVAGCIGVQHKTVYFAGSTTSLELKASQGRVISHSAPSDLDAAAFVNDVVTQGAVRGKKVVVLGAATPTATAAKDQKEQYVDALKAKGVDADFEVLPCVGSNCTSGISTIVQRIKQGDYNTIVLTTNVPGGSGLTALFRELMNQKVRATLVSQTFSGHGLEDNMLFGRDVSAYIDSVGWRTTGNYILGIQHIPAFRELPFGKMCQKMYADSVGRKPYEWGDPGQFNDYSSVINECYDVRALARAIWSLGNNVTSEGIANALATVKVDPYLTQRLYGNTQGSQGVHTFYSAKGVLRIPAVTSETYHYPCNVTKPPAQGCFLPTDTPIRWRSVSY